MIIDARTIDHNSIIKADICIVGSGPAGMTLAGTSGVGTGPLRRLHPERSKYDARNGVDVASIRNRRRSLSAKGFAGLRQGAVHRPGVDIVRSLEHGARQLQAWCLQLPVGNALAATTDAPSDFYPMTGSASGSSGDGA